MGKMILFGRHIKVYTIRDWKNKLTKLIIASILTTMLMMFYPDMIIQKTGAFVSLTLLSYMMISVIYQVVFESIIKTYNEATKSFYEIADTIDRDVEISPEKKYALKILTHIFKEYFIVPSLELGFLTNNFFDSVYEYKKTDDMIYNVFENVKTEWAFLKLESDFFDVFEQNIEYDVYMFMSRLRKIILTQTYTKQQRREYFDTIINKFMIECIRNIV